MSRKRVPAWVVIAIGIGSVVSPLNGQIGERTIAHEALSIEGESDPKSATHLRLSWLIDRAVSAATAIDPSETEPQRARRFFLAVDRALIENDVIFPPSGSIDFLKDGLGARNLTAAEYKKAEPLMANVRRLPWMRANQQIEGTFSFFDCDLASIFYVSVAERLGYPVYMVEVPGHTFIRWQSKTVTLNWDPNDGITYPDDYYIRTWHVPGSPDIWPTYFENLSRARILSTWQVLRGRSKQAVGDYDGALADFRAAVAADQTDLGAINQLAWLLATCPRTELRNGTEAVALARSIVAQKRRAIWLQTLAAARAESHDFSGAVETEKEVQRLIGTSSGWISPSETLFDPAVCLAAFQKGETLNSGTASSSTSKL